MTIPVFAIVIGVSNYRSPQFAPLPGAQKDALRFTHLLIELGIPESHIFLLNDQWVDGVAFDDCLKKIDTLSEPFKLIFYFCGHGYRTNDATPESYLVFSNTEMTVHLETLVHTLSEMKTTEMYLFIDACHLRLNSLINPKLREEMHGVLDSRKTIFCLLSSGIYSSFENRYHQYGYFTDALIHALRTPSTPDAFYQQIQNELEINHLPLPEMYNIGTHTIDLFSKVTTPIPFDEKIKKAIGAIYSCDVVIDDFLFCKIFNIEEETFKRLQTLGLIVYEKGTWAADPHLIEIAEQEQVKIEPDLAKSYWLKQFEEKPQNFMAALHLVLTIQCFGFEQKFDEALQTAFFILYQHRSQALDVLLKSVTIYQESIPCSSVYYLADLLIDLQEFDLAKQLLDSQKEKTKTHCHLLCRTGLFSECIHESTKLIPIAREKVPLYWHRGIAHYLIGNWKEAETDFSFIYHHSKNSHFVGRSLCLLGTIDGIRGINVDKSQRQIEKSIQVAIKNGDLAGAWVGWNNLGEIQWKAGKWNDSKSCLNRALDLTQEVANPNMLIETLRNFLQLELRSPNYSRALLEDLLKQVEHLLENRIEIFETMQIHNTLCTIYLFLNNPTHAQKSLDKTITLTPISKEYHIYTLSNLSLMCKEYKQTEKANSYLKRALALAKEGNNHFAIQQVIHDHSHHTISR